MAFTGRITLILRAGIAAALMAIAPAGPAIASVPEGVAKWKAGDYREAVMLWLPAAARGNRHALFNLGLAYRQGRGVPKDLDRAEDFFRRAAEQDHAPARTYLGIFHARRGDNAKAIELWRKSAATGDPHARYMLGIRYFNGNGLPKDRSQAYGLMLLASNAGLTQAGKALRRMNALITEEEREKGKAFAARTTSGTLRAGRPADRSAPAAARAAAQMTSPDVEEQVVAAPPPTRRQAAAAVTREAAASPPPEPAAPAAAFRVQLGAFARREQAEAGWASIRERHGAIFAGVDPVFSPFEGGFRLQVGAFDARKAASDYCGTIQAAGQACFVTAAK